ncbi:MAG: hypothetical protein ABS879_08020 [Eubacteriales bacterium]
MTRDETIRLEYTYLLQKVQGVETVCGMTDPLLKMLWSDIKSGHLSTERTAEIRRWVRELQERAPEIIQHVDAIEESIRQIAAQEQIRINFKR